MDYSDKNVFDCIATLRMVDVFKNGSRYTIRPPGVQYSLRYYLLPDNPKGQADKMVGVLKYRHLYYIHRLLKKCIKQNKCRCNNLNGGNRIKLIRITLLVVDNIMSRCILLAYRP